MTDFDIQRTTIEIEQVTGNKVYEVYNPAVGSNVAVVYIESSTNGDAIDSKLAEIDALADNTAKKVWTAAALPTKLPEVSVRVIVTDESEV